MARILESFTSPTVQQEIGGRRANAGDFGGQAGAELQGASQTVRRLGREIIERKEEDDTRNVMVQTAKLRAKASERIEQALTSGEDLDKIREDFDTELAEIRNSTSTTKGLALADQHGAVTWDSFRRQLQVVEAKRAGAELAQAGKDHSAAMSQILQKAPELMPYAIESTRKLFDTYKGRVDPDVLQHARQREEEALWRAGVNAAIEIDPKQTLDMLQNGEWEGLRPDDRSALINKAQVDIKAIEVSKRQAAQEAKKAQEEADSTHLGKMLSDWGKGKPWDPRAIGQMEEISPKMREHMINTIDHLTRVRKEKVDHERYDALFRRMYLPEGDPQRIDSKEQLQEELFKHSIDPKQYTSLSERFDQREKPGEKAVARFIMESRRAITGADAFGMAPPNGLAAYQAFQADVAHIIDTARKAGEPVTPYVTPGNPKFIGNLVQVYQRSARDRTATTAQQIRDAAGVMGDIVSGGTSEFVGVTPPKGAQAPAGKKEEPVVKAVPLVQGIPVFGRRTDLPGQPWVYNISTPEDFEKLPVGSIGRRADGTEKVRR